MVVCGGLAADRVTILACAAVRCLLSRNWLERDAGYYYQETKIAEGVHRFIVPYCGDSGAPAELFMTIACGAVPDDIDVDAEAARLEKLGVDTALYRADIAWAQAAKPHLEAIGKMDPPLTRDEYALLPTPRVSRNRENIEVLYLIAAVPERPAQR